MHIIASLLSEFAFLVVCTLPQSPAPFGLAQGCRLSRSAIARVKLLFAFRSL